MKNISDRGDQLFAPVRVFYRHVAKEMIPEIYLPRLIMIKEESVVVSCVIYLNVSLHTYEIFCFS